MAKKKSKSKNKGNEDLVHVRFGPQELVRSKKEILNSEASLIKALKSIKNYKELRMHELKLKKEFLKKLKGARRDLEKTEKDLPVIPKSIKKKVSKSKEETSTSITSQAPKTPKKRSDLDSQLDEIKGKLRELEEQA